MAFVFASKSVPGRSPKRLAVLLVVAAACAASFAFRPRPAARTAEDQRFVVSEYAGSATCVGCHRKESQDFVQTAHARTLVRIDSETAYSLLDGRSSPEPRDGEPEHAGVEYHWADGRLVARSDAPAVPEPVPIDWAFGSAFASTFVTLLDDRFGRTRMLEHHWSWFRDGDQLAITPGHTLSETASGLEIFGDVYEPSATRACFSCHATAFRYEAARLDSRSVVLGVQCERCHGPRKEHARARMLDPEPAHVTLKTPVPARQQVYACGECHRRPDEIDDEIRPDNPLISHFKSVGLVQSKCFLATEASGRLTCTTCHDPHRADRPPPSFYDDRCRDCHDPRRERSNVPCAAEPAAATCLGCHMPKVRLHEHLTFTDHWIRADRSLSRARSESSSGVGGLGASRDIRAVGP